MAIAPPDPHTAAFLNALNEFVEKSPNRLSDELKESLRGVGQELQGYTEQAKSPGEKEAAKYTEGTGNPIKTAARGVDQPSPGQREFEQAVQGMREQVAVN